MSAIISQEIGKKLIDALDLKTKRITDISIDLCVGSPVEITVKSYLDKIDCDALVEVLSCYSVMENETRDWIDVRGDEILAELRTMVEDANKKIDIDLYGYHYSAKDSVFHFPHIDVDVVELAKYSCFRPDSVIPISRYPGSIESNTI